MGGPEGVAPSRSSQLRWVGVRSPRRSWRREGSRPGPGDPGARQDRGQCPHSMGGGGWGAVPTPAPHGPDQPSWDADIGLTGRPSSTLSPSTLSQRSEGRELGDAMTLAGELV